MSAPTIDHRGPEFAELGLEILEAIKSVFSTTRPVVIYPASGTGAWEAAVVDTLNPGDKVLCFETAPSRRCGRSQPGSSASRWTHDEWGVDVTVAGSQKGHMLPPGFSFNAISEKALAASKLSKYDTDKIRAVIIDRYNMSPGRSRRARRKDLPDRAPGFNDMMLAGTLADVQMGLVVTGAPIDTTRSTRR
jgi:hypothetical protein